MIRSARLFSALALALAAMPARAASLFLSTEHPFLPDAPGAVVKLEVRGARAVDVRLYRLPDPERYFLEERSLGKLAAARPASSREGGARRMPGPLALVREALSKAADDARRAVARGVSPAARALLAAAARGPRREASGTLPFLADLELVERWDLACGALESDFGYCDLEIGPRPAGAYLVEAASGGDAVHAVALFSTLAVTARRTAEQVAALAVDSRTGQALAHVLFSLYAPGETPVHAPGGRSGLFTARVGDAPALLVARRGPDVAVVELGAQSPSEREPRAHVVTDRGEYRPGEVVQFHGFARSGDERLAPSRAEKVEVAAYDARGSLFYRSRRPLSPQGGFGGEFALEQELPQGLYRLEATADGRASSADFVVRRTPEPPFFLDARLELGAAGSPATARVNASLEARPVRGAQIRWRAVRYPLDADATSSPEEVDRGEVPTDADGGADIAFQTPPLDGRYELLLIGRDPAGRLTTGSVSGVALRQPLRATVSAERRVVVPGVPAELLIRAAAEGGRPAAVDLQVKVLAARGGAAGQEGPRERVQVKPVRTGADGTARFSFVPQAAGYYEVEVDQGQARLCETFLYATVDGGDIPFSPDALTLIPDKASYAIGETARVLVLAPFDSGSALLTVEGAERARADALSIRGASAVARVKVTQALAPSFAVAVQAVFGERSYRRERRIATAPVGEALSLRGSLEVQGERGELSVEVLDRAGRPLAGAELFATVLDERSVPPSAPTLQAFFHPERTSSGQGASSTTYRSSDAGPGRALGAADGSEEGALPFKGLSQGKPRARDAGALLSATAVSDARGRASFAFVAPPTVSRLTAQVRAAAGAAFGDWSGALDRRLPAAKLAVPRFLREGDRAQVRARLDASPPQEVALSSAELEARGSGAAALEVGGAGEAARVTARFGSWGAEELSLPVFPAAEEEVAGESGVVAAGRVATFPTLGAQESARLFVSADPRAAALAARSASRARSSLAPFAVWRVLAQVAALRAGKVLTAAERWTAEADVAALVGMAHPEGAFGAYDGAAPSAELTAWATVALSLARDEGLDVEGGVLARAAARLRGQRGGGPLALWACALNEEQRPSAYRAFLSGPAAGDLGAADRALLALGLHEVGEDEAASQEARRLERALRAAGALACAGEHCLEASPPRASLLASALTALALQASLPRSPLLPPLARYLLSHRGAGDFGADLAGGFAALATAAAQRCLLPSAGAAAAELRGPRPAWLALSGPQERSAEVRGPATLAAGASPLYWRLERRAPAALAESPLAIARRVQPLNDAGEAEDRQPRPGDRVRVTLRLTSPQSTGPAEVEDPYPAGLAPFEVEGDRESFRQLDDRAQRAFADDRVVFLLPGLRAGETEIQWEAVAKIAGEFHAPPARLRAGELSARSSPEVLVIEETAP